MLKYIKKIRLVFTVLLAGVIIFTYGAPSAKADNNGCIASNGVFTCSSAPNDTNCSDASVSACTLCIPIVAADCGQQIIASINKTTFSVGDQLIVTFQPDFNIYLLTGTLIVNGVTQKSNPDRIITTVNTENGFKLDGVNTLTVLVKDANGRTIPINNKVPATITLGSTAGQTGGTQTQTPSTPSGQTGNNTITGPTNPIQDTNLFDLFFRLLKILMGILGAIAVLMIIIGGFRMVIAQGNEEAYTKAKSTITWAIIGLVIALLSFSIVIIVQNILGANLPSVNTDSNGSVQVK